MSASSPSLAVARAPALPVPRLESFATGLGVCLVLLQLWGGDVGDVAVLVSLPLTIAMTLAADDRFLVPLLTLCLPAIGVASVAAETGASGITLPGFAFEHVAGDAVVAHLQLGTPLVILLCATARVGLQLVMRPGTFPRPLLVLLVGYLLALGPAAWSALLGQAMGLNRWSLGMRAMLALGGVFWGWLVVARSPRSVPVLEARLLRVVIGAAALFVLGILRGHLVFIAVGLAAGALPYFFRRRRFLAAALTGATALAATVAMTLTTAITVLAALGCVAVGALPSRRVRSALVATGVLLFGVASAALIWAVSALRETLVFAASEAMARSSGLVSYALFKLMSDRGPLWLAAGTQISAGPLLIAPSGRPLLPEGFSYGGELAVEWEFGAHNALLELVRNTGLLAGGYGTVMMLASLVAGLWVVVDSRDPALRALAAGFVGVVVAGVSTGNFPVFDVGFFLWALGGFAAALHWRSRQGA